MLGTLVQGRVSLDGAAVAVSKLALKTAITYASERRQFNASSDLSEEVILDYQRHQRRLLPRLAATYAASFAHEELLEKFDGVFSGASDTDEDRQDLETLAAAYKPLSTWLALDTLQECREACGGAGFLTENRFTSLRADMDVYATFEGDNNVLLQLVAKRLLTDYAREFKGMDFGVLARYAVSQAAERTVNRSGLRRAVQTVVDTGSEKKSAIALRDEDTQHGLLSDRVGTMVAELAGALRGAGTMPQAKAAALFNEHQHELIETARAHAELLQWEAFTAALHRVEEPGTRQVLTWLRDLFGLCLLERNLAWYLMNGRLSSQRGPDPHSLHQPAARQAPPARPGPGRGLRLRTRAPPRRDRHRGRKVAPGRGRRTRPGGTGQQRLPDRGEDPAGPAGGTGQEAEGVPAEGKAAGSGLRKRLTGSGTARLPRAAPGRTPKGRFGTPRASFGRWNPRRSAARPGPAGLAHAAGPRGIRHHLRQGRGEVRHEPLRIDGGAGAVRHLLQRHEGSGDAVVDDLRDPATALATTAAPHAIASRFTMPRGS
jgi:hypothetical protein